MIFPAELSRHARTRPNDSERTRAFDPDKHSAAYRKAYARKLISAVLILAGAALLTFDPVPGLGLERAAIAELVRSSGSER
jgi:hypothetical protein